MCEGGPRNIPTGVGRRPSQASPGVQSSEHPHGRGEKGGPATTGKGSGGTSPRAWGEVEESAQGGSSRRNIPTGVGRSPSAAPIATTSTEHPHGRGEKSRCGARRTWTSGTSPRAWGEGLCGRSRTCFWRNIPTGVGRSGQVPENSSQPSEHPHGRGEKQSAARHVQQARGTSPRAWGEDVHRRAGFRRFRNIPTGVGRSAPPAASSPGMMEHPHGRGEKTVAAARSFGQLGTSPRAWGEVPQVAQQRVARRNIPTGVGRSSRALSRCRVCPEHPHGRGEKSLSLLASFSRSGTSPRAWGEARALLGELVGNRNIPTGVGRRTRLPEARFAKSEHPHGRGEKRRCRSVRTRPRGTSPRAWGEGEIDFGRLLRSRNIPTGVGRSEPEVAAYPGTQEHPHGRGEKRPGRRADFGCHGTSPRAWGEARRGPARRMLPRNIPTGVGRSQPDPSPGIQSSEHPHGRGEKRRLSQTS